MSLTRPLTRPLTGGITRGLTQPGAGGGAFDPLSRFEGGQQGIYVDLNDFSTLWQDTARTTPVTAAGQTVRGITDKSGRGNHLTNATGWVLTADGANHYLLTDGVSRFVTASFAWGSDKASLFFGLKKNSGTGGSFANFGPVGSATGTFDAEYFTENFLVYRRGSGSFGARNTAYPVGNSVTTFSSLIDLAGTTQATENPYLQHLGADVSLTNAGTADSGSGNFSTQALWIGDGVANRLNGRIYSFFIVAASSTASEMAAGTAWVAGRAGVASLLPTTDAPAPVFLDTGAVQDVGAYKRTSAFAHADYTTTATSILINGYSTTRSGYAAFSDMAVYVDGVYNQAIRPPADGAFTTLITLSAGTKTVEFRNGLTTSPDASFNTLGTWFVSAKANSAMTALNTTPTNRVLIYGDSIAVGGNATTPPKEAWAMLNRDDYAPDSIALEAFGFRSLFIDGGDTTKRTAFVAKMLAYNPSRIWLAIGTNDYGLNYWNVVADFGTAYGATLDALNAAMPGVPIYAQTPIVRTAGTNAFGNTLQDYRDQITTAVSTRTSFCTLVDGTAILTLGDLADGVHPTTAGHVIYAAAVDAVLAL